MSLKIVPNTDNLLKLMKFSSPKFDLSKIAKRLKTPRQVQLFLNSIAYNRENTQRSALEAIKKNKAHCFEGAFIAAAILEYHGFPPLVLSIESKDGLDHVLFLYRKSGRWGSVAQSRDEGLRGRPPIFRSLRDLVWSYFDPYVDKTGRITAYQIANLDDSKADWRRSKKNVFKAENYLLDLPHRPLRSSDRRYKQLLRNYLRRGPMPRQRFWW